MFPVVNHPDPNCHVWDFWYYYDEEKKLFHLFFLNASSNLVPLEKHHFASQVGYATTRDFIRIDWKDRNVLQANSNEWYNTSIWSGDVIKIKSGFLMFFTSRNKTEDDGMTQNIGIAFAKKLNEKTIWKPIPDIRIAPNFGTEETIYEPKNILGDLTIHAWRDPFLFKIGKKTYMLVSAKSVEGQLGKNGAIGILCCQNNDLIHWKSMKPIAFHGCYSEMEVPQLYIDRYGHYVLIFSTRVKSDFCGGTHKAGGFQELTSMKCINTITEPPDFNRSQPNVLMPESSGLYACRVIHELNGEIVGFDIKQGGIRRSGIKTYLKPVNRNFTNVEFQV